MDCPEFACLCPVNGRPDFAHFTILAICSAGRALRRARSLAQALPLELHNEGAFHEAVTNRILSDLVEAASPRWMEVRGAFDVRGGIGTTIVATHGKKGCDS